MMIRLTKSETSISLKIRNLKESSGTHSPSILTLKNKLPDLNIIIDACFLSNPYATKLFLNYLNKDLLKDEKKIKDVLEFYPSQNNVIAKVLSQNLEIDANNIFVGNGAIEIIQAVLHNFNKNKIIVNIPTFSPYYEYVKNKNNIIFYELNKAENYTLDTKKYIKFVKENNPDTIILINPNNPDGQYIKYQDLRKILLELKKVDNIIIDESFVHFAYEDQDFKLISATNLFKEFENVIVIKSMSKDFGIAGIRCGYGIMNKHKVFDLLKNGYLWNLNGLSEYFFRLYVKKEFFKKYESIRKKYIDEAQLFFKELKKIKEIKVYDSKANFALIELIDGSTSGDFVSKLMIKYGIYTRNCSDKIGLEGEFVRIAARTKEENSIIINSIKKMYENK